MMKKWISFCSLVFFHFIVLAEEHYNYYTIEENEKKVVPHSQDLDTKHLQSLILWIQEKINHITLLKWIGHKEKLEDPKEPYSRRHHYGDWIRERGEVNCLNTRARVLVRNSVIPVQFRSHNSCIVDSGKWYEPMTGRWVYLARELQIDHVVPVKSSYELGGFKWTPEKRCMYFNFLAIHEHLVPIDIHENSKKGSKGPEIYMPPNKDYWCDYLKSWLKIKLVWELPILINEGEAIYRSFQEARCDTHFFVIDQKEINKLRQYILDQSHQCYKNKKTQKNSYEFMN